MDVIAKTKDPTEWVSPLIVTPKKDGDIRLLVIDMRRANDNPITTIEQLKKDIKSATVFSNLDLRSWRRNVNQSQRLQHHWVFADTERLSLGIKSASEANQQVLEQRHILIGLKCVQNISDNIIVWGKTEKQHNEKLLSKLSSLNLTLKKSKCEFMKEKNTFLSVVFSSKGVLLDP